MPQARLSGPMPWVIAIMVAMTVIAAAAGLALRNVAASASAELTGGITVQIVEAGPEARRHQALAAADLLRTMPDVAAVRLVPQDELDSLIAPWLGEGRDDSAIPVPALIDARVDGVVTAERVTAFTHRIRAVAPAARVDAQTNWLRPVFGAIASLQWLSLALILLLTAAMAAAVLLAARTALGNHRATIEVVHMLGGTDLQIARIFQRAIGIDAAVGGGAGFALGLVVILLLGHRFADLSAGLVDNGALGWRDWVLLALVPLAGVGLAMATARLSVLGALRRSL